MICVINCGTAYLEDIKKNLKELDGDFKVINIDEIPETDFNNFSGVVITGSPAMLTKEQSKYLAIFSFIKSLKTPVFGVCFGHQILGLLYGSEIKRKNEIVHKKESIEIVQQSDLLKNIKNLSLFHEEHFEFISLPDDFNLLAKSTSCDNEAMVHKSEPKYGVQFHPEASGDNGKLIFKNFLEICNN